MFFGLETEYGVFVENCTLVDIACAVKAIIESYPHKAFGSWDYSNESPRRDMRGFYVKELAVDPREEALDRETISRSPDAFEPCNKVLTNGGRLYHDHAHPEYSTPECRTIKDLVAHDKAGERIVLMCAREFSSKAGVTVKVFKNNTDFHGSSYGTHENYLLLRSIPFEAVAEAFIPFLCTRIIFTGAGKVGSELARYKGWKKVRYQLSQRAEHFDTVVGADTQFHRPILNTRDEPHADEHRYRRLHIIAGDANMSQYATALKVGTTAVVVEMLENGWRAPKWLRLADPVKAFHEISMDEEMRWVVELDNGKRMSAIDIQRLYLETARKMFPNADGELKWVLTEWEYMLDMLESNPLGLSDRLDWVAKLKLIEMFMETEGADCDCEKLKAIDLAYHNVDLNEGLYYALEAKGMMKRMVSDEEIERAIFHPPTDTRALIRGWLIAHSLPLLESISWCTANLLVDGNRLKIDMRLLVGADALPVIEELRSGEFALERLLKLLPKS